MTTSDIDQGEQASPAIRRGAQTAKKALTVLRIIVEAPAGLSLAELVALGGVNRSTTYRLVRFLEDEELVARDKVTGHYGIGSQMMTLAAVAFQKLSVREIARPTLHRISDFTTESVLMYVRNDRFRICIDGIEGRHVVRRTVQVGRVVPLYEGPTGAAIVACLDSEEQEMILEQARAAGHDVLELQEGIESVRERGYVTHYTVNIGSFSIPLLLPDGKIGAITVSGPGDRCREKTMSGYIPFVFDEVKKLSAASGITEARNGTRL